MILAAKFLDHTKTLCVQRMFLLIIKIIYFNNYIFLDKIILRNIYSIYL